MSTKDSFIPNTFQTPNAVIDRIMFLLSESEFKVLMYAIRHILGWKYKAEKKQAAISLSNFEGGFTYESPEGETFKYFGTGLTRGTIMSALKALVKYKILEKGDQTSDGQIWRLRFMIRDDVDIAGLTLRYEAKKNRGRKQTEKAREKAKKSVQQTNENGDDNQSVEQTEVVSSTDRTGLSNRHNETHSKEHSKEQPSATQSDRDRLFDGIAYLCFGIDAKSDSADVKALLKKSGSRIGKIKKYLTGLENPCTPEELFKFFKWYKQKYPDADFPRDDTKFAEHFTQFRVGVSQPNISNVPSHQPMQLDDSSESMSDSERQAALESLRKVKEQIAS